jgi:pilus assembly protein CpaC
MRPAPVLRGIAALAFASLLLPLAGAVQARSLRSEAMPVPRIEAGHADRHLARKVDIGIGKSVIIDLPADAKEVFVANPGVANAVIRSTRKLFIIGVSTGSTSIYISDGTGAQIADVEVDVGREMGVLDRSLRMALPTSAINVTPVGDSIVLTGTVDNVLDAQRAVDIATAFIGNSFVGPSPTVGGGGGVAVGGNAGAVISGKVINALSIRARDQVMVKVTVAEVKRNVLKQLGVSINGTWNVAGTAFRFNNDPSSAVNTQAISPGSTFGLGNNKLFDLRAAERQGVMRMLAEPTLTAISGETAKFTAGGEIPVPTTVTCQTARGGSSECSQIQTSYKPYGVQLIFTPMVLSEGRISLRVATEVTDIDVSRPIVYNGALLPSFTVRKQDTTVELPSGGSLVTAGLIQQVSKQTITGLPGLMNVPVLGALFRSRDYQREDTELMMIVTPYIAKPNPVSALAQPDEGYADANDAQTLLMGRLTRIYGAAGAPTSAANYRGSYGFIHD